MTNLQDFTSQISFSCDRLGCPVDPQKSLGLAFNLDAASEENAPSHRLTAFTTETDLLSLAGAISRHAQKKGHSFTVEEIKQLLLSIQASLQLNDDDFGALSPFLELLLQQAHPNVRLKTAGKYNAEGRHVVLLRTAPGDGGWNPAHVIPSQKAEQQWRAAGLVYPESLTKDPLTVLENKAVSIDRDPLVEALARRRALRRKMANIRAEIDDLTPIIRNKNCEDARQRMVQLIHEIKLANTEISTIKGVRGLILAILNAISADREVDPIDQEYHLFSRAFAEIEHDFGRFNSPEAIRGDVERAHRAMMIAKTLITSLPDDPHGQALEKTLAEGLGFAELTLRSFA